jgi:hypothetical protein
MLPFSRDELKGIDAWLRANGADDAELIEAVDGKSVQRQMSDRKKANTLRRKNAEGVARWRERHPKTWAAYMRKYRKWKKAIAQALQRSAGDSITYA